MIHKTWVIEGFHCSDIHECRFKNRGQRPINLQTSENLARYFAYDIDAFRNLIWRVGAS